MKRIIYLTALCIGLSAIGCEEQETKAIYDPNEKAPFTPVITEVEPAGAALANFSAVTIKGQNFSGQIDGNIVYFNNVKAPVLSASSTQITVKAPPLISDAIKIQVVVEGAFVTAKFEPYKLEPVSVEYGGFSNTDEVQTMTLDQEGNLYTFMTTKEFMKITPEGERTVIATTPLPKMLDMKAGPNDSLIVAAYFMKALYRLSCSGGELEQWVALPGRPVSIDYDENHHLYGAGNKTGMYHVTPDGTADTKDGYAAFNILAVRVYDGYLYFLGSYTANDAAYADKGIWRSQILNDNGDLGDIEEVLDWSETGDYAGVDFYSFTFSLDGDIYVGTAHKQPVLHLSPGGNVDSLYQNILYPSATKLEWGNDTFMYINVTSSDNALRRVYKVQMLEEGAPYYGRQ